MPLSFVKYLILFLVISVLPSYAQNTVEVDKEMRAALEKITSEKIPGLSVAIARGGNIIWSGAAGYSNIEERQNVSQNHLFGIGNISNNFIAVVILQMASENLIDLNATPYSILGDTVSDIDNTNTATVYQLLNHTSGIYSWADDNDWVRRGRGIQMNPRYRWEKDEPLKYITKNRHVATNIPGQTYVYSNSNYTILGLIIEKLSGGMLEDEVRRRILEPLKLKDTYYDTYELPPKGQLIGSYHFASNQFISTVGINAKFDFGDDSLIDTSGASLSAEGMASGIVTTPRDLATFAMALRDGSLVDIKLLNYMNRENNTELIGTHSSILGFTADMHWLKNGDLVIVSLANIGTINSGDNEISQYLNTYVEKILLPIAKKYVN